MKKRFEVSVPCFLLPYVEVEAENELEAKKEAGFIITGLINNTFKKNDFRTMDCGGIDSPDWKITEISNETTIARELLPKMGIDGVNLNKAYVSETFLDADYDNVLVEYIYLDFGEKLNGANYCYIRRGGVPFFLADNNGAYPADLEHAKTYVWKDEKGSTFLLNDNFEMFYLAHDYKNDIIYKRLCVLNQRHCNVGVIIIGSYPFSEEITIRPLDVPMEESYIYFYKDECAVAPISGKKVQNFKIDY